jgi:hypothetical protein
MSNKGFFASICDFFKGLFSADESENTPAGNNKNNDGLTGVERYIRNQQQGGSSLTGVERYIRNQMANGSKPQTGVEKYIRQQAGNKPMTGVERYIQNHQ